MTAIEWCEARLLSESQCDATEHVSGQLIAYLPDPCVLPQVLSYFIRQHHPKDSVLIEQDAEGDEMLLVDSGEVTIMLRKDANSFLRIRTMGPGSIVGELALFGNQKRAATVIASSDVTVLSLSRASLRHMEAEKPHLANMLHRAMSALLAERLVDTTAMARALSR